MEPKIVIETMGFITKEENLKTITHSILSNTFVLEAGAPFPGYNGKDLPGDSAKPQYIYLVTNTKYTQETIARATFRIKKYFKHNFDAVSADVTVFNVTYACIRIKDLDAFDYLEALQICFKEEGLEFAKRRSVDNVGIIKTYKIFRIEEIAPGIFSDMDEPQMSYLEIPMFLNWKMFYSITMNIKNNISSRNFDAATGGLFRKLNIVEFIRVFETSPSLAHLQEIQKKYLEEIAKFK